MALQPVADALAALSSPVHKDWFPYALAPTIHAARISIAYQANARRSSGSLSWGTYIAGYLIMCWGGTLLTHNLLGVPPPVLHSFHPYINYLTVHLALTYIFQSFPAALHPPTFDTALFPIDALVRTGAITGTLSLLAVSSNSPVHPLLVRSPLTHLIIGALASSGGGITASTLSTWSPSWTFSTPPILSAGVWGSVDFWGGALVAAIYGVFTRHEAFIDVTKTLNHAVASSKFLLPSFVISQTGEVVELAQLSPPLAKALGATVLSMLFGLRAWKVHWSAPALVSKKKAGKSKIQ
ncbi:hypothetical protein BDZ94DRAFT_1306685 [Collybia nuda]|uniref:Uncharacterized protein n=1 Tax=Collybia nuda TaxID=64659 RepID=A0A9P5YC39_9AGAR|nr:hypothetical protein BDZ94DRAFT_1306685 [Collybia nuda]